MSVSLSTVLVCAAPADDPEGYYAGLIGQATHVVAVDDGASLVRCVGRRPDSIVGDLDSLEPETAAWAEGLGVEVMRYPRRKDLTDLDLALEMMQTAGGTGVCVTAAWSGRLDHTAAALGSVSRFPDLEITLGDPGMAGWVLDMTYRSRLTLAPLGATVSLIATIGPAVVSCAGMEYPLDGHSLSALSSLGISNTITGERAEVQVHEGTVCVIAHKVGTGLLARGHCW